MLVTVTKSPWHFTIRDKTSGQIVLEETDEQTYKLVSVLIIIVPHIYSVCDVFVCSASRETTTT